MVGVFDEFAFARMQRMTGQFLAGCQVERYQLLVRRYLYFNRGVRAGVDPKRQRVPVPLKDNRIVFAHPPCYTGGRFGLYFLGNRQEMASLFGEHLRRYFFRRVMHPPVSGSVESQAVFVPAVNVGKRSMACKVVLHETHDVFHSPLAFRVLLAAHVNLESALPDVGGELGREDQIAVV